MVQLCPNCFEEIKESGKCSGCDGQYCEACSKDEKMTCPHCGKEHAWEKY